MEIWNGIPGQSPVKKFQGRKKAVARVWAAIQPLTASGQPEEAAAAPIIIGPLSIILFWLHPQ